MIQVKQIPVGPFEMNCYVVSATGQNECLIIDPGDEPQKIISYVEQQKITRQDIRNALIHPESPVDFGLVAPQFLILTEVIYDFTFSIDSQSVKEKEEVEQNLINNF